MLVQPITYQWQCKYQNFRENKNLEWKIIFRGSRFGVKAEVTPSKVLLFQILQFCKTEYCSFFSFFLLITHDWGSKLGEASKNLLEKEQTLIALPLYCHCLLHIEWKFHIGSLMKLNMYKLMRILWLMSFLAYHRWDATPKIVIHSPTFIPNTFHFYLRIHNLCVQNISCRFICSAKLSNMYKSQVGIAWKFRAYFAHWNM